MGDAEFRVEITRLTGLLRGQEVMRQQFIRQHEELRVTRDLWKKRHAALHSWKGLMSLLDEHYPVQIFDGSSGDEGPRIVALVREVDRLRTRITTLVELNTAEHDGHEAQVLGLNADLEAERSSRQAWAEEAMRLELVSRERKRLLAEALNQPRHRSWGQLMDEANRLAERRLDELAAEALAEPRPDLSRIRSCACVTDEQAAALPSGFSRPMCAVHPTPSDLQADPTFGADLEYKGGGVE